MKGETASQKANTSSQELASKVRVVALGYLARREYSRTELTGKLSARFAESEPDLITSVLDILVRQNLQSDPRYAEALIRSRSQKGKGLLRIRQELRQKGVADSVTEAALAEAGIDWFELARCTAERKFGGKPPADWAERNKRCRFLQYRGFGNDEIQYALR